MRPRCEYCGAYPGNGGLDTDRWGKLACIKQHWCEVAIRAKRFPPSGWSRFWKKASDALRNILMALSSGL